jgi:hypothetical protein
LPKKAFWLAVNAELVIYGATEPGARVSVAGRPVRLRPDGTFSLRLALPAGQFTLPVSAVSGQGDEGRYMVLRFARETDYWGASVATEPPSASPSP